MRRVHGVRLGGVSGVDTGTNGTEYFDGFVSRRATYIGVVPNDGLNLVKTESRGGKVLAKPVAPGVGASSPAEEKGIIITYTFDHANRLKTVTGPGLAASYVYDGLGDRVSQTVNDVTTDFTLHDNIAYIMINNLMRSHA